MSVPFAAGARPAAAWFRLALIATLCWPAVAAAQASRSVTTDTLDQLVIHPRHVAPASVVSNNDSSLSAQVDARIDAILVEVGDVVEKDADLVRLEDTDFRLGEQGDEAAIKALQAQLRLAQAQLSRASKLTKTRSASEELLNQRQSEVAVLKAQIKQQRAALSRTRVELERCVIRAPFAGAVVERLGSVGELARPGTPLLRLVGLEDIDVVANVQRHQLSSLQQADAVTLRNGQTRYAVTLDRVVPVMDPRQRSQQVRLTFSATGAPPGEAGTLEWHDTEPFLPANLLVRRDGALGVFTVVDGAARFMPLPGAEEGRPAAAGMLAADTVLVVDGRHTVQDGTPVTVQ